MNAPTARPAPAHRSLSLAAFALSMLAVVGRGAAEGATIFVTSLEDKINSSGGCSLKEAILSANGDTNFIFTSPATGFFTGCVAGSGDDTIVLPAGEVILLNHVFDDLDNPFGPTATPMITSRITIEMNGTSLQWVGSLNARAFAVSSTGDLTLRNAYIKDFVARGGDGASGGGGGLGAGGAVYVKGGGSLTVDSCTFEHNGAIGGGGSAGNGAAGGGGGGMGGNGGAGGTTLGGGGGGGSRGNGAVSFLGLGGGGGGTLTDGVMSAGGMNCGAAGGESDTIFTGDQDGHDAGNCPGGGGGGGVAQGAGLGSTAGNGGAGGYGGGGGGGGNPSGGGTEGGDGGFGGGGGASGGDSANFDLTGHRGGNGGLGGGGGAGHGGDFGGGPGQSLAFGGLASHYNGGGGAGLGGAVFNDGGTVTILNSTLTANYGLRGVSGGGPADNGADAGGAIFSLHGTLTVLQSTISGNGSTGSAGGIMVFQFPQPQPTPTFFTLHDTIVSNNGPQACVVFGIALTVAGSGNLIQENAACPGAVTDADPLLGPLALNGGPTPTMAIADNSPAFDAGDIGEPSQFVARDQRGAFRPQGAAPDIGAYEVCVFDPKVPCFGFHAFQFTRHLDTSAFPAVGGAVSPTSGDYPLDSVQPLTATANPGFTFLNWTGNVADPASVSTFVVMDQDQSVAANFAGCVNNLSGRGAPGTAIAPPRVDLTWSPIGADHVDVLRAATSGGPYTDIGTTARSAFSDTTSGLVNNTKWYYRLQVVFPANAGEPTCSSNETAVTIPKGR
jgi:hypothetical protein